MLQSCKPTPDSLGKRGASRRLEGNNVMKRLLLVAFFGALVPSAPTLHGTPRIAIHVSPVVAMEPALLTIRTTVEPSDENRKGAMNAPLLGAGGKSPLMMARGNRLLVGRAEL